MAEKLGYDEKLAAPDQVVQPKIKEAITKARASANISKYLWAAIGVAIGNQDAFYSFRKNKTGLFGAISQSITCLRNSKNMKGNTGSHIKTIWGKFAKDLPSLIPDTWRTFKAATKEFYSGKGAFELRGSTFKYGKLGKMAAIGLTALAAGTTLFGIVNAKIGFKKSKDQKPETTIKNNKNCVEV
ncbi:hypothetical protein IKA15_04910 [bacterium]|nr:hypothetical protein [bacterium]